jgi:NADH:ubiquinone oxidoreductase subunit 5 (subunit L)/multisubunit Na+/H+ antiporter MnhA subunit
MAMRAPTPISSLVHSSTLVTAGIYTLISYFNLLFCRSFLFLNCVGLLTLITSGVLALLEQDGKKVVALRTLNQLGFMVTTIALGLSQIVLFHLLSHAFFKRIMFMQLGYFISILLGSQKLSNHSLLYKGNSFNILLLLLINFTLLGLIISLGFTSKERLLIIALFSFRNKDSLAL